MEINLINNQKEIVATLARWLKEPNGELSFGSQKIIGLLIQSEKPVLNHPSEITEAVQKLLTESNKPMNVQHIINTFDYNFDNGPKCVYGALFGQPTLFQEVEKYHWRLAYDKDWLDELLDEGGEK